MICVPVCQAGAIDLNQKRKKGIIRVGAIIVSPGYDVFDARATGEYGYGRMKNVVNSLEFERFLNADGPYHGEVLRPSDAKAPAKIAWLQCVGSRDIRLNRSYCSSVCCTYAIKQALLVKHHYPQTQVAIFHNDIRTHGKGSEDLYRRAQAMDVHFIKKRISAVKENGKDNNLTVSYVDADHSIKEEEFGMVVLSVGADSSESNKSLAQVMGLELNEHGFCRSDSLSPGEVAGRPGIFPAATFTGPMDIPESISSANGAGALAAQLLSSQRGTLTQTKTCPEERTVAGEELKIGVFVCHCGTNIASVADTAALAEYATTLSDVVHCEEQAISCAADSLQKITEAIKEKGLNRVVVAACTPRDHEAVFREALREAGLNAYLLDMANIREHCTWVHAQNKEEATEKAKDIIAMSVARARNLAPLKELELPVNKKGLVLGGGLAGIKAALSLARQGFEVYLVEKEKELGGNLRNVHYTLEGMEVQLFLSRLRSEVESEKKIRAFLGYELKSFAGHVGNFRSTLVVVDSPDAAPIDLEHGIIIVATGGKSLQPAEYRYGESEKIVTQQEFEGMIAANTLPAGLKQVAIIQCVGARNEERPYCGRICCGEALKNALKLKSLNEKIDICIFYRDMRADGFREDYYLEAREKGILFVQYQPDRKPEVMVDGEDLSLTYYDSTVAMSGEVTPDLLVLSTPMIPEGNQELSQLLRVPVTGDGFFMEAHMKLRPLDFATDGMFLCGTAHYPKYIPEAINQANGAALRAATILSQDTITSSGAICEVNEDACIGCNLCVRVCPYGAIELKETAAGKVAEVTPAACKGCGVCDAVCPTAALSLNHFTDQQIFSQIEAAYSVPIEKSKPRILAVLCHWCGYAGADLAGVSRIQYAANIRPIRVMCAGGIHPKFIYDAFLKGMDAVLVVGCHPADCHYISGIDQAMKTIPVIRSKLEKLGISPERLRLEFISAAEGAQFARAVDSYTAAMTALGSVELDAKQREKLLELKEKKAEVKKKKGEAKGVADSAQ